MNNTPITQAVVLILEKFPAVFSGAFIEYTDDFDVIYTDDSGVAYTSDEAV